MNMFPSTLNINNDEELEGALLSYTQKHICDLNSENKPCAAYSSGIKDQSFGYNDCIIKDLGAKLLAQINCTLPFLNSFLKPLSGLPVCSDLESSQSVKFSAFKEVHKYAKSKNPRSSACPFPCCYVSFSTNVVYYHKNIVSNLYAYYEVTSQFALSVVPQSDMIEEQTEVLIYDLFSLLSSGGGNLGLFLGFSCLSIIFGTINWMENKMSIKCD